MSYRTFKHLLGETSLERKCRFIFTGGILILVTFSFWWYGQKTESLVIGQTTYQAARRLVPSIVMDIHSKAATVVNKDAVKILDDVSKSLKRQDDLTHFESRILDPYPKPAGKSEGMPADPFEEQALARFLRAASSGGGVPAPGKPAASRKPYTFNDGSSMEEWQTIASKNEYQYVQAILFKPDCLYACHKFREERDGRFVEVKPYDLACAAVVHLSMTQTNRDIHKNRAILIAAALVTAILAMVAAYVIVRYVIVKPVKHLRDVSDAIAAGKLTIRSQIQTGDEFEELSHAFNRMLHNLVAMQQELRDVNRDLDRKVDELAQANMALFEMNRLKSDFLATMSHELRTPLNSIIGFSEVLSTSETLTEKHRRYASNIQSSGKMLLTMINDILDLAKIESGKMEVRAEDFSIRDVCESLTSLTRPLADRKNISLECRIAEAIPLVRQDPGKLRQILYNLLSNAIKFTPDGGRVQLSARAEGRNVIISVCDTGIGIAEEDREKIFEKFRQVGRPDKADSVLTREHQGTGLGLSIVRELTKLLGGDIELESRLGQGSTFTIRLPMQLHGSRKFDVPLVDEKIDITKARRIEARAAMTHLGLVSPDFSFPAKRVGEVGTRRDGG
ncbi:MAG: HAMP domain-containing sensor histidine kinase [Isosphaeraceae bacterium]|nr:HAMP domain-containing sensor histidine kinase [Isosphaeraceae bacterium]